MSIKVFKTNKAGKIEFTRCELEKLLNETYNEGYRDGENHAKSNYWTWTSPSIVNTPYYGTVTCDNGSLIRSNTADSISGTVTLADKVAGSNEATIATSAVCATPETNAIKVDVCAGVDSKIPDTAAKATVKEAPARTFDVKGMTYNMEDLVKTVDALLGSKSIFDSSLYAHPDVNGAKKATENDAFTNLAKELRGL